MRFLKTYKFLKNLILSLIALSIIGFFFSYKILEIPGGLTSDEASFGYNAVLLAETLHDQNKRFLPLFVLSADGIDWRQPVTQYYLTAIFKIFGSSVFLLRFSSVIITLVSTILIFFLSKQLLGKAAAFLASFLFLTTPLIMIQSHMGLDNIMPIPFVLFWMISLLRFQKNRSLKYLLLAGILLGIGFYSYKGMRAIVPVWFLLTVLYLKFAFNDSSKDFLRRVVVFVFGILPFFAMIPLLEIKYAGAILGGTNPSLNSIYTFLYPYFSSFDPTFLFIKGDDLFIHSTGIHGMMLLASAPLFFIGCYQSIKKKNFWLFILAAFFLAPLLYGLVGSVHRASRLMAIIPLYSLLATLGGIFLWRSQFKNFINGKIILLVILVLMFINYFDFVNYYWFAYPAFTHQTGNTLKVFKAYKAFAEQAKSKGFTPYLDTEAQDGDSGLFFEAIYFDQPIGRWTDKKDVLQTGSVLLSPREEIPGFEKVNIDMPFRHLQTY